MLFDDLLDSFKDYARDVRLNLSSVITEEGSPGLTQSQIAGIAMACSYKVNSGILIEAIRENAGATLTAEQDQAAKGAATVMAMNNVYYRSTHMLDDGEIAKMPARLRMNIIGKHGINKSDFELYCLAVSAIAGCGACLNSHVAEVRKAGVSNEGVQSALRIAAVINGAAQALSID